MDVFEVLIAFEVLIISDVPIIFDVLITLDEPNTFDLLICYRYALLSNYPLAIAAPFALNA